MIIKREYYMYMYPNNIILYYSIAGNLKIFTI